MRTVTRPIAVLVALVTALTAAAATTPPAGAAPPSPDPDVGAAYGSAWLVGRVNASGYVPLPSADPNIGATLEVALGLASTGVEQPTFDAIMGWLSANVDAVVAPAGGDNPGNLGYLLMLTAAAGVDATSFGGVDLVARLGATLGDYEAGLFGADDPSYDGAFRQSLAILGLVGAGAPVPAAAKAWLADQQCSTPVAAAGGWQPYRADTSIACDAPNPTTFTGPDTNSTAIALTASKATAAGIDEVAALGFLAAAQSAQAGWPFIPGGDDDPNSTALVIVALVSAGQDPTAAAWTRNGLNPFSALLAWQIGCDGEVGDRGAFASPFSSGLPDEFASRQAVLGAAGRAWPIGRATFGEAPDPCAPAPTSTQPDATSTTVSTVATPPAAAAVAPAFTG